MEVYGYSINRDASSYGNNVLKYSYFPLGAELLTIVISTRSLHPRMATTRPKRNALQRLPHVPISSTQYLSCFDGEKEGSRDVSAVRLRLLCHIPT